MISKLEFIFLMFISVHIELVSCTYQKFQKQRLYNFLFANYSSNLPPECEEGKPVQLEIDIALRQILDLNEPEQILEANIWMRLSWTDCRLVWDPANYNNIKGLMVLYGDVWQPDITLYDSASTADNMFPGREKYRTYIAHNGKVSYNFPTVTTSICGVNVKHFPFDTQVCKLNFGSWSYHGLELDIFYRNDAGDLDTYIENSEWIIQDFPVRKHVKRYNCCPEPFPDVTYFLYIQRRPTFYVITMLFPCVLVVFVAGLTFILPIESGEKVSLEITVLLSLSVFLLIISEALPPSSDNFPAIGLYFAASMVLVNMALLQTVFVVNLYYRGNNGRRAPRWVRRLFFGFLGKIFCSRGPYRRGKGTDKMRTAISSDDIKVTVSENNIVKVIATENINGTTLKNYTSENDTGHHGNSIDSTTLNNNTSENDTGHHGNNIDSTTSNNNTSQNRTDHLGNNIDSTTVSNKPSENDTGHHGNKDTVTMNGLLKEMQEQRAMLTWFETAKHDTTVADEWKTISNILDRLFFVI